MRVNKEMNMDTQATRNRILTMPETPGVGGNDNNEGLVQPEARENTVDGYGLAMTIITRERILLSEMTLESPLRFWRHPRCCWAANLSSWQWKRKFMIEMWKPVHKHADVRTKERLAYLMFLKHKRCGKIKGRGCADGRKQRAYITKEESTAPTVSTEAVFLTAVIDAMEGRNVVVLDVPGAFMQAKIDELVHVRFRCD